MLGRFWQKALFCILFYCGISSLSFATTITQFTPTGTQPRVYQVYAVFSNAVVKAGDAQQASPFDISCSVPGNGRWLDDKRWVYDFSEQAPAGVTCTFKLRDDFEPTEGGSVTGKTEFMFSTGGPSIRDLWPSSYSTIEEEQIFKVIMTGKANLQSVRENVWCEVPSVKERVPITLIDGKDRAKLLATVPNQKVHDQTIFFKCARRLPAGSQINLVWGEGVSSLDGKVRTDSENKTRFDVRKPFGISVECDRLTPAGGCLPFRPLIVRFSSPVDLDVAKRVILKTPTTQKKPEILSKDDPVDFIKFSEPFDEEATLTLVLPNNFKDASGRALDKTQTLPITITTDTVPPLAKFSGNFGILESKQGGVLPLTIRKIETPKGEQPEATVSYVRFDGNTSDTTIMQMLSQRDQLNTQYAEEGKPDPRSISMLDDKTGRVDMNLPRPSSFKALEVIGIPLEKPGFYLVEVKSQKLGQSLLQKADPMYVRSLALVTNMAVHFKHSQQNGVVWVTALDTGKVIAGADVQITRCDGKIVWAGKTDAFGLSVVTEALPDFYECSEGSGYLVTARLGDDLSFVHSDFNDGIEPWRFNFYGVYGNYAQSNAVAHVILDRTLFKAGETVSMKLFARQQVTENAISRLAMPQEALPDNLRIQHLGSGDSFTVSVAWKNGSSNATFTIPDAAKQGTYSIELDGNQIGTFYVSDFKLPILTGRVTVNTDKVANKVLPVSVQLGYLSGGPASGYPVQLSAMLQKHYVYFEAYSNYHFDFYEDALKNQNYQEDTEPNASSDLLMDKEPITLDDQGNGQTKITKLPDISVAQDLITEIRFRDPNGEQQTISSTTTLWPAEVLVGITADSWNNQGGKINLNLITVDTQGQIKPNTPVTVTAYKSDYYTHRRRVVGAFYTYDSYKEVTKIGSVCTTKTDQYGQAECEANIAEKGDIIFVASASDGRGNAANAMYSVWVDGENTWFGAQSQDRIDILPDKQQYEPGETATFQVRMPFRQATALIAVEQEGVIRTFIQELTSNSPSFDLPILAEYGPNVYVSVLAVRGRVEKIVWTSFFDWGWKTPIEWFKAWWNQPDELITSTVDLAKPAYKFGISEIGVGRKAHELAVDIKTDKAIYQTKEKVKASISVTLPDGSPAPKGTEVILVAVDQALLELKANDSWDLLTAMYPKHAYGVTTSTAQMQVIGKRHYGRKAVAPGGGGGMMGASVAGMIRQDFNPLITWLPSVTVDDKGQATVDFTLNDSLTTVTIVAIAAAGSEDFGTAKLQIKSTRDLQLFSGISPIVRHKDQLQAAVTVHNSTQKAMTVNVVAEAAIDAAIEKFETKQIKLEAGQSQEVSWTLTVPEGSQKIEWQIRAQDIQSKKKDSLKVVQDVLPVTPVTIRQVMLAQLDPAKTWEMMNPKGALAGQSRINISLAASIAGNQEGLRRYFETYPFNCLEQQIARSIGLNDDVAWSNIMKRLPDYLDSNGLIKYYPSDYTKGSVALTAHLLSVADEAGKEIPESHRLQMQRALLDFVEGRLKLDNRYVYANEATELKIMALNALSRARLVRSSMLDSIQVDMDKWPTSTLIDFIEMLNRSSSITNRAERIEKAENALKARLIEQGTKTSFSTEASDHRWTMMANGDSNAVRLVLLAMKQSEWKENLPTLIRGAIDRQVRGSWSTTTANVWGVLMMREIVRQESQKPAGQTIATLADKQGQFDWQGNDKGQISLAWGNIKAGSGAPLTVSHQGAGKPWVMVQSLAAVPLTEPVFNGFTINRELIPVEQKVKNQWSRGDRVRVRLTVTAKAESGWVVVSDPIVSGARILGANLGRDSLIDDNHSTAKGNWPAFEERRFDRYTAYFDRIRAGEFIVEYVVQLNSVGRFGLPPTRVESLYAPEVFAEIPNASIVVVP